MAVMPEALDVKGFGRENEVEFSFPRIVKKGVSTVVMGKYDADST